MRYLLAGLPAGHLARWQVPMPADAYFAEPKLSFEAAMTSAKVLNGRLTFAAIT
jgi:hypothetical protein